MPSTQGKANLRYVPALFAAVVDVGDRIVPAGTDVTRLLLLLALAGSVAHLAAVVARYLVRFVLAVSGAVTRAVAPVPPEISLLGVSRKVSCVVALVALVSGQRRDRTMWAHVSTPASSVDSVLEVPMGKVSKLRALVPLRHRLSPPPPWSVGNSPTWG
ncbi:hypothetical protein HPB48_006348 [Haemaphysalis longicornis]|uniref:Uncharacterized protein n=1 Tax=Haemaphysalis longicornis TaxID=44386 RepID=A0A9J6GTX2_HAELO|nr:hypothetical protein HPB48_006348 [Haemaphysalis longicornis]